MTSNIGLDPVGEQIIVLPTQTTGKTKGGIVLPEEAQERPTTGRVIAVGDGVLMPNGKRDKPNVNVGDKVLFDVNAGVDIDHEGLTYTIMPMRDVYLVVEAEV